MSAQAAALEDWFIPRRYVSATYGGEVPAERRYRVYVHAEFAGLDRDGRPVRRRMWLIDDRMAIECGPVALDGRRLEFETEHDAVQWLRRCVSVWAQAGILDQQMYIPDDWWRSGRSRWQAACHAAARR